MSFRALLTLCGVSLALAGCPEDSQEGDDAGTLHRSPNPGSEAGTTAGNAGEAGSGEAGTGRPKVGAAGTGPATTEEDCSSLCTQIADSCGTPCTDDCDKCTQECEDDAAEAASLGLGSEWREMIGCCNGADFSDYCDEDGFDPCQKGVCKRPF